MKPTLAITAGEPAGIGPDLVVALANNLPTAATLVYVGDPDVLHARAEQLRQPLTLRPFTSVPSTTPALKASPLNTSPQPDAPPGLYYAPVKCNTPPVAGRLSVSNSTYVIRTLEKAVTLCEQHQTHGIVTGPVHKGIINAAGIAFSGHTEWLQQRTNAENVVMLMANDALRVALTTTHIPLNKVSQHVTAQRLMNTLEIVHAGMQTLFGIPQPRIAICGVNPHAGEGGHLGHEEIATITPVIERLRTRGWSLLGPLPADTAFIPELRSQYDVCVTHFHDQGLPVLKALDFENTVNISLGLPLIRCSVDHGTALTLAGAGKASATSFRRAIEMAAILVQRRQHAAVSATPPATAVTTAALNA